MSFWMWFLVGIAVAVGLFAYYLIIHQKVLAKFDVSMFTIEPATLVYTTYQGQYQEVGPLFGQISCDLDAFLATLDPAASKDSSMEKPTLAGVYYDNPYALQDPKKGRALAGFMTRGNLDISQFLRFCKERENGNVKLTYHTVKLGRLQAFGAHFPLTGFVGMMANIMRGYPAIQAWSVKEKNGLLERSICSLETYDWENKQMGICMLYGKNAEALHGLSKYPQPEQKHGLGPVKTVKRRV